MKPITSDPNTSWYPSGMNQYGSRTKPVFKTLPEGRRKLSFDETIKAGDLYTRGDGSYEFASAVIGMSPSETSGAIYRRPKKKLSDLPYPKDSDSSVKTEIPYGYMIPSSWRKLNNEVIIPGDVFRYYGSKELAFALGLIGLNSKDLAPIFRRPSAIAVGHNPNSLTEEAVRVKDGYRLLTSDEIRGPQHATVQWNFSKSSSWRTVAYASSEHDDKCAYRTKAAPGEYPTVPLKCVPTSTLSLSGCTITSDVPSSISSITPSTSLPDVLKTLPPSATFITIGGVNYKKKVVTSEIWEVSK